MHVLGGTARGIIGSTAQGDTLSRIVLDPEDVNQDRQVTMTDGTVVDLDSASRTLLDRIARQLHVHRSTYQHALRSGDAELDDRVAAGESRVEEVSPLYLRVAALQAKHRKGRGRAVDELDLDLLFQTRVWVSSAGASQPLSELTPSHRRNLVAWLERNTDAIEARVDAAEIPDELRNRHTGAQPWVTGTPLYRRLQELIAAETGRDLAIDRARQIVREVEFQRTGEWPQT